MNAPTLRFPIKCPECDRELLLEMNVEHVAAALLENHALQLYSICHKVHWVASENERQQIREYLGAGLIRSPRQRIA